MTRERRRINELKVELAQVKQKLAEVERDREHYRVWFIAKLKWFIQLRGSGETPEMSALIENMGRLLNRVATFHW